MGSDRAIRADASRNRAMILDAALAAFSRNPRASMSDIAASAGVGRVTLYGHFSSRDGLLDAVLERTMDRIEAQLAGVDLEKAPWVSLADLIRSSWRILDQLVGLLGAAELVLSEERIREYHDRPMSRVQALLLRGRSEGAFRADQPAEWQVACFYAILHSAAAEVRAGRLNEETASLVIPATIRSLLLPTEEATNGQC